MIRGSGGPADVPAVAKPDHLVPPRAPFAPVRRTCWPAFCFLPIVFGCAGGDPGTPVETARVLGRIPHDTDAFTQGFAVRDSIFWESTGLVGKSRVRRIDRQSGAVLFERPIDPPHFGEGLALAGGDVVVLTWRTGTAFRFGSDSLEPRETQAFSGEGWGLAHDGKRFWRSDGTSRLTLHDTESFAVIGQLDVTDRGKPVPLLNELEFVRGELWANVWKSDRIARINPESGRVVGWVDASGVFPVSQRPPESDVLNGIAYDALQDRIFVTGKNWPWIFEIQVRGTRKAKRPTDR